MQYSRRSHEFDEYLRSQPLARRKQLMDAEKDYATKHVAKLAVLEGTLQETLQGFEDTPVGRHPGMAQAVTSFTLNVGDGDWSWRPYRYAKDPGHIFMDAEIEALYPGRVYVPNARLP
jgi:hypothetical protein